LKVVAPVYPCKSPIQSCLVFVVTGTVFCKYSFSIRGDNGMQVGAEILSDILGKYRRFAGGAEHGNGLSGSVMLNVQHCGVVDTSLLGRFRPASEASEDYRE